MASDSHRKKSPGLGKSGLKMEKEKKKKKIFQCKGQTATVMGSVLGASDGDAARQWEVGLGNQHKDKSARVVPGRGKMHGPEAPPRPNAVFCLLTHPQCPRLTQHGEKPRGVWQELRGRASSPQRRGWGGQRNPAGTARLGLGEPAGLARGSPAPSRKARRRSGPPLPRSLTFSI